ncbi:MAG: hypothetical protein ISR61_06215 [Desulfobacteraceae bacterium]|nr:hypothetical protein [Desulfobacteraceae bacterium]
MNRPHCSLLIIPLLFLLSIGMINCSSSSSSDGNNKTPECNLTYNLPADMSSSLECTNSSDPDQCDFDNYSWQTFMALSAPGVGGQVSTSGDNLTQWAGWSSTADLLDQGSNPGPSGSRFYPTECRSVPNYQNYRVIDQVGKVDDSFLEAQTQGLSANPVIASNGTFLRYEILLSPATYDWVVSQGLNTVTTLKAWAEAGTEVNFICGDGSYTGGDPANSQMGAIVLKNAWMEITGFTPGDYHREELLVYTPDYRNSTGQATCELKTMGLVGMHIAHKTLNQPNWIWSTFEHANNAPDCTALPDEGDEAGDNGPSVACPDTAGQDWNFFGTTCDSGSDCQTCNTAPVSNASTGQCVNPSNPTATPWCVDQPPNPAQGLSRICRQFPVTSTYPTAGDWNTSCDAALAGGVWSNYQLISTQWISQDPNTTCINNQASVSATDSLPKTPVKGKDGTQRPFLGNTSMESYERPNCTGCHVKGSGTTFVVDGENLKIVNDFMYWLVLEVPAANNQ